MNNLEIIETNVTISVVRVGGRSMTKAVFSQIPIATQFEEDDIMLGFVNVDFGYYLIARKNNLFKVDTKSLVLKPPASIELANSSYRAGGISTISELEYTTWKDLYALQSTLTKDVPQLFIST